MNISLSTDSILKFLTDLGFDENEEDSKFGDYHATITTVYTRQLYLKRVKQTEEAEKEVK